MAIVREFNGERFYLKESGHYRNPKSSLHRRIWESYNGPIQDGMVVHHIDDDPSNNEIENLMLMTHGEHTRLHVNEPDRRASLAVSVVIARQIGNIIDVPVTCEECGSATLGARKAVTRPDAKRKRFCSRQCCARADYKRRKLKETA